MRRFNYPLLSLCLIVASSLAHAQSCDDIKDKDKANYCRAINANDGAFCKKISNGDMQNLCMGKIENDPKYCKRIMTEKFKKRCENSLRK